MMPSEQRFLSFMAFSAYEVIRVACLSRSWFVYAPWEPLEQAACDFCLSLYQIVNSLL